MTAETKSPCDRMTLRALRTSHQTLSILVERTSNVFSPILISTLPLSFFNQVYGYYFLCIGVFNLEELIAEQRFAMVMISLFWLSGLTVHMVNLFCTCDCTIAQAKATKDLLLKMSFSESIAKSSGQEVNFKVLQRYHRFFNDCFSYFGSEKNYSITRTFITLYLVF